MADPEVRTFVLVFFFFFEEMLPGEAGREAGEKDRKRKEAKQWADQAKSWPSLILQEALVYKLHPKPVLF